MLRQETRKKLSQALLMTLLSASVGMISPSGAKAQDDTLPAAAFQPDTSVPEVSPAQIKAWKDYIKSYPDRLAAYQDAQKKRREAAQKVVFTQGRDVNDIMNSYPFLKDELSGAIELQEATLKGMARHENNFTATKESMPVSVDIYEDTNKKTGQKILFVRQYGQFFCGTMGCPLEIYVNNGKGYKLAMSKLVQGEPAFYLLPSDKGPTSLFVDRAPGTTEESLLIGDSFIKRHDEVMKEPDSQLYVVWRDSQAQGHTGTPTPPSNGVLAPQSP